MAPHTPGSRSLFIRSAVGAAALTVAGRAPALAQTAALPIRIAGSRNDASGSVYYAAEQGLFDKAGLAAQVQTLQNGAAIGAAIAGGTVDVGASSPFVFMNAVRHGLPFTIVGPGAIYDSAHPTAALVVAANGPYKKASDLDGKVLGGITVGALDQLTAFAWLDQNGGDSKSVQFVEVPLSTMADALEAGRIAAAVIQEPQWSAAGSRVRTIGKCYDAIAKRFMISIWFATKDFAERNPVAVKRFGDAVAAGADWGNANPDKAALVIDTWTQIKETTVLTVNGDKLDPALIQPIPDMALKYRMIDAPMNARDFIWHGAA